MLLGCADLARHFRRGGFSTVRVRSLRSLLEPRSDIAVRAIVLGPASMGKVPPGEVVAKIRQTWPLVDVVVWAPDASARFVRSALQGGARDVLLTRSPDICANAVVSIIDSQQLLPRAARLGAQREDHTEFEGMVSRSPKMWDLFDTVGRVAPTNAAVLILGETGTGKELLARAVHRHSKRRGRFVAVNCAATAENLIDSELFGHVQGAFTGAIREKSGLFRHADEGTLMLDEIGNIPHAGQHRLLRALQEGAIRPVGGQREIEVDVRVIAATSIELEAEVREGRFREDLFYRLDVIRLDVPPLRERPEDVVFLFGHFSARIAAHYNLERPEVTDGFLDVLASYDWPGNVRQLENTTERVVLTHPNRRVTASQLRKLLPFQPKAKRAWPERAREPTLDTSVPMAEALAPSVARLERQYIEACLRENEGRIGQAAERAGISRRTLLRKLKSHGIDKKQFRPR
ncbi:MAG: sigma-54 interaction domain-containing protein [Nannocystaceae bacterium]|nr:sigma-54 dependent transcriptional regulator [bacterium]